MPLKFVFYSIFIVLIGLSAFKSAEKKLRISSDFDFIRSGISIRELEKKVGQPLSIEKNENVYILDDGSELRVTVNEGKLLKANLKFNHLLKIQDPKIKGLTLVQIQPDPYEIQNTSWFYAGDPNRGMIYKVSSKGFIEGISWLPPFHYPDHRPKQLQALLQDFRTQTRL